MRIEYRRDSRKSWLVLSEGQVPDENSYLIPMLTENELDGFLTCTAELVDRKQLFLYDITSMQSLKAYLEQEEADRVLLDRLAAAIADGMETLGRYLLPVDSLQLSPDLIFLDMEKRKVWLTCYPDADSSFSEQFRIFCEYLLPCLKQTDRNAGMMGYAMYQKAADGMVTSDLLRELLQKKVPRYLNGGEGLLEEKRREWSLRAEPAGEGFFDEGSTGKETQETGSGFLSEKKRSRLPVVVFLAAIAVVLSAAGAAMYLVWSGQQELMALAAAGGMVCTGAAVIMAVFSYKNQRGQKGRNKKQHEQKIRNEKQREKKVRNEKQHEQKIRVGKQQEQKLPEKEEEYGIHDTILLMPEEAQEAEETILLAGIPSPGMPDESPRAILRPSGETDTATEFKLTGDRYILGKNSQSADLVISSPAVSRMHACLRWRAGRYFLEDLRSRNGTWINGAQVSVNTEYPLCHGDTIRFADREFRYEDSVR